MKIRLTISLFLVILLSSCSQSDSIEGFYVTTSIESDGKEMESLPIMYDFTGERFEKMVDHQLLEEGSYELKDDSIILHSEGIDITYRAKYDKKGDHLDLHLLEANKNTILHLEKMDSRPPDYAPDKIKR